MSVSEFALYSANVFTGDNRQPWAEAVGVKNGLIAALGSNREVKAALPRAEAIDLDGHLVTPGLVDAHCHFISFGRSKMMMDLKNMTSLEACRKRIQEAAANLKPGQWLVGRGWNHFHWDEGREPTKADIDDILPHNPAMMVRVCGHSEWLNSRALEIVGITAESVDPPGGKYERDTSGNPSGMLRESRHIVEAHIPQPGLEELKQAALAAQSEAIRSGLTGVHTCESLTEWRAFAALEAEGLLKIRVHHLIQPYNLEEADSLGMGPGYGSNKLWVGHVKLFADGALGSGTALLNSPYCNEEDNCGLPFLDTEELKENIMAAYARGYNVAIHAIGDRAGTNALDAIAYAREKMPGHRRDRIEHVQLYCPEDLSRYREMDITASVQPVFVSSDWSLAEQRLGTERCCHAYNWKTLLKEGIRLQFGSDAPVEPIAPILGLQAAVLRQSKELMPAGGWRPEERLGFEEGLSGFFQTAAYSSQKEDHLGVIAPGRWADLTVFERNLAEIAPEEWSGIDTAMTVVDGEIVYGD